MQNFLIPRDIRIPDQDKCTMVKSLLRFVLGTLEFNIKEEIWDNLLWMTETEGYIMDNLKMRNIKWRVYCTWYKLGKKNTQTHSFINKYYRLRQLYFLPLH